jgi:DNA recombination protein RmuC
MDILFYVIVPIFVMVLTYLYFTVKNARLKSEWTKELTLRESDFSEKMKSFEMENLLLDERLKQATLQLETLRSEYEVCKTSLENTSDYKSRLFAENKLLVEKIDFQAKEFERLQKQAASEFENIANRILKRNTEDFSELNHTKISELIQPLKEKIQNFEKKVEETYEKGLKDQTDLKAELKKLNELNNRISDEASNLTKALKGDVKQQGNWGEVILERILERSGLTEGQEFLREVSAMNSDGKSIRPDVIINLPDKKHIIIDSKVSLVAYERYVNSDHQHDKDKFIKEHLLSIKNHVKELHDKHYSSSPQFNSPDFVLLFIPIESSFSIAVEQDQQLFNFAWENKVVIVCPSTLLATLRTIASIWQQENQTKNAIEIARQGGALYDKFVGFLEDLEKIGKNINALQHAYDDASKKLNSGSGNLIGRVEKLKELGASTLKKIPDKFGE